LTQIAVLGDYLIGSPYPVDVVDSADSGQNEPMRIDRLVTAGVLAGISGLHVAWGLGSSFPSSDRESLADTTAGSTEMPPAPACFAVAGLLAGAASLVMDALPVNERLRRAGVAGVGLVLGARGVLGVAGHTGTAMPWDTSERFTKLDRRYYGPLCLALSAGALSSLRPR